MSNEKKLTTAAGCPVVDNQNVMTAGPRGPQLLQDVWFLEKLAHFDREVIPERRMHAKGSGAYGTFTVTHDITPYTRAKLFSAVGKKTELFARFTTVAGERGAADAERDIRGFAVKFYTEEGNWDMVGNNTDAAGPPLRLWRCAALPARRQSPPDTGQCPALPGAQLPPRWRHARRRQPRQHPRLRA